MPRRRRYRRRPWWVGLIALVLAGVSYYQKQHVRSAAHPSPPAQVSGRSARGSSNAAREESSGDALAQLIQRHESNPTNVESAGTVFKILPDDTEGDRHQRFLVRLAGGNTILIAHNIDLAARVPVHEGEDIRFKGEYIWNDQGGVVHWTHHDPRKRHAPGWIEINGKRFD
jgi:hypothetical protein